MNHYDDAVAAFLKIPPAQVRWGRRVEFPGVMDLVTVAEVVERFDAYAAAADARGRLTG